MARITANIMIKGLSGKLGKLVFRQRNGKTQVYRMAPRSGEKSDKLTVCNDHFRNSMIRTREAMNNPVKRAEFQKMAKKQGYSDAYHAALSYYLREAYKLNRDFQD